MSLTAVILAGGLGSRLGETKLPKCLVGVKGRPALDHILAKIDSLAVEECIITTFHRADMIESWINENRNRFSFKLKIVREEALAGTSASLLAALKYVKTKDVLVLLGDVLFSSSLQIFYDKWLNSGAKFGFITYVNSYMDTCDIVLESSGKVEIFRKNELSLYQPHMNALSGIMFASFVSLEQALVRTDEIDFEARVLHPHNLDNIVFFSSLRSFYDIGTPDRLLRAQNSKYEDPPSSNQKLKLVLIDRDDTIIFDPKDSLSGEPVFLDYFISFLELCNLNEVPVIVLTNQARIGRGIVSSTEHLLFFDKMFRKLFNQGVYIHDYFFCDHNPERFSCECRKPRTGLLNQVRNRYTDFDTYECVYLGDSYTDFQFASNAGLDFIHISLVKNCGFSEAHKCLSNSTIQELKNFLE